MEKNLCEAKFKANKPAKILLIIASALILLSVIITALSFSDRYTYRILLKFAHFLYELTCDSLFGNPVVFFCFWIGVLVLIYAIVLILLMNRCAMTIYTTRVSGKASFGKQVDLPLKQISAVALSYFDSITVATSAGKISFWLIENRSEVYDTLNNQLAALQKEEASVANSSADPADQIGKYKDLLDKGVITQEEFDAKKKQLLGL